MSYETVSERIKLILSTVEGVYNVHTYMRDFQNESDFEKGFKVETEKGPLLSSWMMTRKSIPAVRPNIDGNSALDVTHNIEVQGTHGMLDEKESELTFQKLIDNILLRFKTKFTLEDESGVSLSGVIRVSELNFTEIGVGQFSNYFVHYCRFLISVQERI